MRHPHLRHHGPAGANERATGHASPGARPRKSALEVKNTNIDRKKFQKNKNAKRKTGSAEQRRAERVPGKIGPGVIERGI
jgi:hypothetical protein